MLGVLGSFGDGMMQPLLMLVLGDIINSYGAAGSAGSTGSAFSSGAVDKVGAKNILLLHWLAATVVLICSSSVSQSPVAVCRAYSCLFACCGISSRSGCCISRLQWARALS